MGCRGGFSRKIQKTGGKGENCSMVTRVNIRTKQSNYQIKNQGQFWFFFSLYINVCLFVCVCMNVWGGGGSRAKTMKILSVKIETWFRFFGPTIPNNISYSPISSAVFELLDHKYADTNTHTHIHILPWYSSCILFYHIQIDRHPISFDYRERWKIVPDFWFDFCSDIETKFRIGIN